MWLPIALKFTYTVVLFGLIGILFREAYLIWFDDRVFIGRFEVIAENTSESETSDDFAKRIVNAQVVLSQQLADYERAGGPATITDATFNIADGDSLSLPRDALKELEITVQSVNLTQIFSALRKGFSAPNEISGHVTKSAGSVLAVVEWPRAPRPLSENTNNLTTLYVPAQATIHEAARYIGCSLSWVQGAAEDEDLARIPRLQFCDFAMALGDLYDLKHIATSLEGLSIDQGVQVRRRIEALKDHDGSEEFIPGIYRLRADLIDLLPDELRSLSDLVEAQDDRLSYAMLDPSIAALPPNERKYAALALARPAIPVVGGELEDIPRNWESLLTRHSANIENASQSTAILMVGKKKQHGGSGDLSQSASAFLVAPNLALTVSHAFHKLESGLPTGRNPDLLNHFNVALCFGDNRDACKETLRVSKVHYLGNFDENNPGFGHDDVALLEVEGHIPSDRPALPLLGPKREPHHLVGSYAFVVGYPFKIGSMPPIFQQNLIGNDEGTRRIMPGRLLAFNVTDRLYTSDVSTTAGTSGGPLIDLSSGVVLAINFAVEWRGDRGSFAYALEIPEAVKKLIEQRLRGEQFTEP